MRLLLPRIFRLQLIFVIAAMMLIGIDAFAQSSDARFPTPVSVNEIVDSIAARDLGDSRLTDYFYTFTGIPGDLLLTLESKNLNGDVDVFTAGELRPLLKMTFYAENTTSVTKNIYLRKRESLILRVEARTPNDEPGTYRIRFSGSFEPISRRALAADSDKPTDTNKDSGGVNDRKTTRVSSVGARIDEPVEEVAAAPTPQPTADATRSPEPQPEKAKTAGENSVRTILGRRRQPRPAPTKPSATAKDSASDSEKPSATSKSTETSSAEAAGDDNSTATDSENKTVTAKSKPASNRSATVTKTPARSPGRRVASQPQTKPRLVIEERDGTRREFLMSNVRKVTVENGEIVVEANDGYTQRIPMSEVARMSIGP